MDQFNFDDIAILERKKHKKYRGEDNLTLSELDEMSMREEIKEHFPYEIYKTPDNIKEYIEKQKPLRVKIRRCSDNDYWYKDEVGKEFEVIEIWKNDYLLYNKQPVLKKDCEVIKEEKPLRMKVKLGIHEKIKFECTENDDINGNEQPKNWQKLLEDLNIILKRIQESYNENDKTWNEIDVISGLFLKVISLMEKEIDKNKRDCDFYQAVSNGETEHWKALEKEIEESNNKIKSLTVFGDTMYKNYWQNKKENQKLKEEIEKLNDTIYTNNLEIKDLKEDIKYYNTIIIEQQDKSVKLYNENKKLKRYNSNLLNDKIMIQKANKNLRKQIHQLTDGLDNKQIKIDDDVILYYQNITKGIYMSFVKETEMAKRLLQQLNKE